MHKKNHNGRRRFQNNRNNRNNNRHHNHNHQNRNNNIANRVWDSNGPAGRIRGTAQQLVDKYISLAEEQTGPNADGILRETLLQFAEHYQRMLVEAGLSREQRQAEEDRRRQEKEALAEMTAEASDDSDNGEETSEEDTSEGSTGEESQNSDEKSDESGILDLSQTSQPVLDLSEDPAVRSNMEDANKLAASKNAKRHVEGEEKPAKKARARKVGGKKTASKKSTGKKSSAKKASAKKSDDA